MTHRRYLTWFLEGQLQVGTPQRETYMMDQQYIPLTCSIHSTREATYVIPDAVLGPNVNWTEIDILADGVSILDGSFLILTDGVTQDEQSAFLPGLQLETYALVTVNVRRLASGEPGTNVTVELVLETLQPDDET